MRLKNIDFIKGLLIILVILGHIIHSEIENSILRTIIYSFHMPLFVGISGFLFNANKIANIKLIGLLDKYKFRIILPWIIAVSVYYLLMNLQKGTYSILGLFEAFYYPFFHLWFILGFLSWVIMTWFFKKIKLSNRVIFIIAFSISVVSYVLKIFPALYSDFGILSSAIDIVLYTFRPYFYLFFVLGVLYNNSKLNRPNVIEYVIPLVLFISVIILYYFPNNIFSILNFFLFNFFVLNLVLKVATNNMMPSFNLIEWIGLNSLGIYLWHMIPVLICKSLVGKNDMFVYYSACILLELFFLLAYKYLLKIGFLKKYIFGL